VTDVLRLIGVPGTNKVMAGELSRLTGRAFAHVRLPVPAKEGLGALAYPFDLETAALAVRYHRTSSRVLWGLFQSRAERLEPLYEDLLAAMGSESRPWFRERTTFSVSPANTRSFAAGGRQMVGVVKNAVINGAARQGVRLEVDPEDPDVYLEVRVQGDVVTVSVDLAGRPMNQRGYRDAGGTAPLRENLAAVLVMLARYDARREVLVDPMAGSGTIAIEAACMAQGKSVWVAPRVPAAHRLALFTDALERPAQALFADTRPLIMANELEPRIHRVSQRNLANAGVGKAVASSCGDFRGLDPRIIREGAKQRGFDPDRGVILSNPPYGERLDSGEVAEIYRDLGHWCRQFRGWRAAFLVANREFEAVFGGRPRIKKPLRNGPLRAYFYLYIRKGISLSRMYHTGTRLLRQIPLRIKLLRDHRGRL
jgi:23S rRNA G2445 N2-methylase RlmL